MDNFNHFSGIYRIFLTSMTHGKWKKSQEHLEDAMTAMGSFDINKFIDTMNINMDHMHLKVKMLFYS